MEKGPKRATTAKKTVASSSSQSALSDKSKTAPARSKKKKITWQVLYDKLGWVFHDTWNQATESHLLTVASSLAYTTILSIVPLIAVSFAFFRAVGGMDTLYSNLEPIVLNALAEDTGHLVMGKIREFVDKIHAGTLGISGFAVLIFTSMSLLNNAEKAINHIWKTPLRRTFFNRIMSYWFIITIGPLGFSLLIATASSDDLEFTRVLPSGFGAAAITVLIFFAINKWMPGKYVNTRPAIAGALFTTLLWVCAQKAFSIFASQAVNYNKIYGSLGAIPIFMIWIYLSWVIILVGTAFSAAIQKRFEL